MRCAIALSIAGLLSSGCSPILGLLVRAVERSGSGESTITLGERIESSTRDAPDRWRPPCGAHDGGGDRAYVFVPPETGPYRVEVNARYDSVVAIFDAERRPIVCNDDSGRTTHSMVERPLEGGVAYTIVVDGYRGATGDFEVSVDRVPPPTPAPEPEPEGSALRLGPRREGDTRGQPDARTPPCGATPGSPDQSWSFTPPAAGQYQITVDATFDGVLAVYAPGQDAPLACNDDHASTRVSQVVVGLAAGVPYEVVIDGYHGARGTYGVTVRRHVPNPRPGVLAEGQPVRGDTRRGADLRTSGCGTVPGSPDQTWLYRPTRSGTYVIRVDAAFDATLAVYAHGAPEPIECNDDAGSARASELALPLEAGHVYAVVVDGHGGASGEYALIVRPPTEADPSATDGPPGPAPEAERPTTERPTTERPTTERPTAEPPTTEPP